MNLLLVSSIFSPIQDLLPVDSTIGFVATASEHYEDCSWVEQDRQTLISYGYSLVELAVSFESIIPLKQKMKQIDALFVSGGNTFYLMQQWKKTGFDQEVLSFISQDKLYIGSSAGCAILGPTLKPFLYFDPVEEAPELTDLSGLNVLPFIPLPHNGTEEYATIYDKALQKFKKDDTVVPFRDNQIVRVVGPDQYRVITCKSI